MEGKAFLCFDVSLIFLLRISFDFAPLLVLFTEETKIIEKGCVIVKCSRQTSEWACGVKNYEKTIPEFPGSKSGSGSAADICATWAKVQEL